MKIGLLTTSFPRYAGDVAGTFVLGFARALSARGHELDVLAPEPRERVVAWREPGITVKHVPYLRPRALERTFYGAGVPDNLARDPLAWLGLAPFSLSLGYRAWTQSSDWQAVISHWALPCAIAAGIIRAERPHLAVLHSADVHLLCRLPGGARLCAHIARGANTLWFVSQAQRRVFLDRLPASEPEPRTVVCPMGIDLPADRALAPSERAAFRQRHQLRGFCIMLLSRLVPIKGIDVALRAAALGGDITLIIAGEGPMRAQWRRDAERLNVPVRWLGSLHGEEKYRWLEACDAFALPSRTLASGRSEGLPCALLEALACAVPAVASDLPGIRELAETCAPELRLVRPDDPAALHRAWVAMRDTPAPASSRLRTANTIRERFGWDRVGAELDSLLASHDA